MIAYKSQFNRCFNPMTVRYDNKIKIVVKKYLKTENT